MKRLPEGLWPVMITPFTLKNEIDFSALEGLCDFYVRSGVGGLFANCLSSEMFQLTTGERLQLIKRVVKYANVPVVATGTLTRDFEESIDFIKKVHDTGVSAVVLVSSLLIESDSPESSLQNEIERIMEKTGDIPLGMYECPVPYKRLLSADTMRFMASSGRFFYHKDTSCNTSQIQEKINVIKGSNLNFLNADTPTSLASFEAGANGVSPISANFYPEVFSWFWKEFKQKGKTDALIRLHAALTQMDAVVHSNYPLSAKLFLQKRGIKITTQCRLQNAYLQNADKIKIDALLESFEVICTQYGIKPTI